MPVDEPEHATLSLTDETSTNAVLGNGLLENSDERGLTPEDLAQGREHVQAYEDQKRQEIAAETVEPVMHSGKATAELEAKPA